MTDRRSYKSDLSDAQWELVEPIVSAWRAARLGLGIKEAVHDLREIVNAILYVNRTGVQWEYLPHDFPPAKTVYDYYAKWSKDGTDRAIGTVLRRRVRRARGRAEEPSAVSMDSQSVKTAFTADADTVGFDGGKRIKGRKRNIVTDTLGLLIAVIVTAAGTYDGHTGRHLIDHLHEHQPDVVKAWADGNYRRLEPHATARGIDLEITTKGLGTPGFKPLWQRWKTERTLGWLDRSRRLARDYETTTRSSESQIHWTMNGLMLRKLTNQTPITTYRITPNAPSSS